ncbi:hypothetical protein EMIT0196P_100247 [Pseudomonas chlororaphis]
MATSTSAAGGATLAFAVVDGSPRSTTTSATTTAQASVVRIMRALPERPDRIESIKQLPCYEAIG